MHQINDYKQAEAYLYQLQRRETPYNLKRMRRWLARFNHPERLTPVIHVAGTNGKGSTTAMLEAIGREAGWRVGMFTSPHLVYLGERIQVNRKSLSKALILRYLADFLAEARAERAAKVGQDQAESLTVQALAPDLPSFFEVMTLMAWRHFAHTACQLAVVEVGLGGRLDATNLVLPEVAVITSISRDHEEILGHSLASIAREKAGIIKRGRPVVMGILPPEAEAVVRAVAARRQAPLYSVAERFGSRVETWPLTNLEGRHQRANAAVARLVAEVMPSRWGFTPDRVKRALQHVDWPGRWQRLKVDGRDVILEAAHNEEGAQVLVEHLRRECARRWRLPVVVVGVLGASRAQPLLQALSPFARAVYLVEPAQARACSTEELLSLLLTTYRGPVQCAQVKELFPSARRCHAGSPGDWVLVTGSVYLVGEVLARIQTKSRKRQ